MIIQIISIVFLVPACMVCGYYWFLAIVALTGKSRIKYSAELPKNKFAIIIPAHNEERTVAKTLKSCDLLNYPPDKFKVFVIADNCSDKTSEIALEHGVICLERKDSINHGKGFTLEWALDRIPINDFDAVIVLDADCFLDSDGLIIFDMYLSKGNQVLQANDVPTNPDDSAISYAISVGNFIENEFFYSPKSRLGMSVFLRGTGFVLHSEILKKIPWKAHSNVEDVEYTLNLLKDGIGIKFISEVKASSEFPFQENQLHIQRKRWSSGNLRYGRKNALSLMMQGLKNMQWVLVDAGWTLLVLSRPLVLFELFLTVILAGICNMLFPGVFSTGLITIALLVVLLQLVYFLMGIVYLGLTQHRLKLLASTPLVVLRLVYISLIGLFGVEKEKWVRTPRQ